MCKLKDLMQSKLVYPDILFWSDNVFEYASQPVRIHKIHWILVTQRHPQYVFNEQKQIITVGVKWMHLSTVSK